MAGPWENTGLVPALCGPAQRFSTCSFCDHPATCAQLCDYPLQLTFLEPRAAQDYYVYLALTQNTNIYNLQAAAKQGLDVSDDSYTSAPGDCQYANSSATANGGRRLLHGDDMHMDASPSG